MNTIRRWGCLLVLSLVVVLAARRPVSAYDVVLNAQGEYLDAYLIDGNPIPRRVVFIDPDPPSPDDPNGPPPRVGRHVNGQLCFFPKGFGNDGGFIIADDTYREACVDRRSGPQARCGVTRRGSRLFVGQDPDGWGVFRRTGKWARRVIHVDAPIPGTSATDVQGAIDPQGCHFDATGRLFAVDVGSGSAGSTNGSLIVFFPGPRNHYDTYCYLDKQLSTPGMPATDAAGNLYIPEPAGARVTRFAPPFPTSAADCPGPNRLVTVPPTKTVFLSAATSGLATPSGIARIPATDRFFVGSVVIPNRIDEFSASSATGAFVRTIVPAGVPANPLGLAVGTDGTLYYAELNLDPTTFRTRCGRVSRVRFDGTGAPLAPEVLGQHLRFPDGVTVVDSRRLRARWDRLPPSPDIDPARCGGE